MKILLDECLPKDLKKEFSDHEIKTVKEMKWQGKQNGELLLLLSKNSFDIFITIDTNLVYQQNLKRYSIIIAVIEAITSDIETLIPIAKKINKRINSLQHGRIYRF